MTALKTAHYCYFHVFSNVISLSLFIFIYLFDTVVSFGWTVEVLNMLAEHVSVNNKVLLDMMTSMFCAKNEQMGSIGREMSEQMQI